MGFRRCRARTEPGYFLHPRLAPRKQMRRITDQAWQLAALEQALAEVSVVNEARVAAIRLAIEQGEYEVSPERIAVKLLRTERELSA